MQTRFEKSWIVTILGDEVGVLLNERFILSEPFLHCVHLFHQVLILLLEVYDHGVDTEIRLDSLFCSGVAAIGRDRFVLNGLTALRVKRLSFKFVLLLRQSHGFRRKILLQCFDFPLSLVKLDLHSEQFRVEVQGRLVDGFLLCSTSSLGKWSVMPVTRWLKR